MTQNKWNVSDWKLLKLGSDKWLHCSDDNVGDGGNDDDVATITSTSH